MGNPPPQVTWHKSGGTIPPNRTELLPGGLHLSHVRKGDEGMYVCEMNNGVGQPIRHSAMLHVLGKQSCKLSVHTPVRAFVCSSVPCVYPLIWFAFLFQFS